MPPASAASKVGLLDGPGCSNATLDGRSRAARTTAPERNPCGKTDVKPSILQASARPPHAPTMFQRIYRAALGIGALLACTMPLSAQQPTASPSGLRHDIERADSAMFAAYNARDGDRLGRYFAPDLEFYHDTGGLLTWAQAMAGLTSTFTRSPDIQRTLVGPIEVYPIRDYGAIEVGVHQFCHVEDGRAVCGTFKFTHIWRRTATGWQVARAVSYDH